MYSKKTIVIKILIAVLLCTAVSSYFLLLTTAKYTTTSSVYDDLTLNDGNNPYALGRLSTGILGNVQSGNNINVATEPTRFTPAYLDISTKKTTLSNILIFTSDFPANNHRVKISCTANGFPQKYNLLDYELYFGVIDCSNVKFNADGDVLNGTDVPNSSYAFVSENELGNYLSSKINEKYANGQPFSVAFYIYSIAFPTTILPPIDSATISLSNQLDYSLNDAAFIGKTVSYGLSFEKAAP